MDTNTVSGYPQWDVFIGPDEAKSRLITNCQLSLYKEPSALDSLKVYIPGLCGYNINLGPLSCEWNRILASDPENNISFTLVSTKMRNNVADIMALIIICTNTLL